MASENPLLLLTDPKDLLRIDEIVSGEHEFTGEEILHFFTIAKCLWQYEERSGRPHTVLVSGKHSTGYIDVPELLAYTPLCDRLGNQLAAKIRAAYSGPIDWVVGSDHAGADFSQSVARALKARHAFTEKEKGPDGELQTWKRHTVQEGEVVLQVEELIAMATTVSRVRNGIIAGNRYPVTFAPIVGVLVNRSPFTEFEGSPLVDMVRFSFDIYEPANCRLCKEGSLAIEKPKYNWKTLTGSDR